jgi:glycosyltransferase involved in cell wall biosynthesis
MQISQVPRHAAHPPAKVVINGMAKHATADAARIFLENLIAELPTCWPEAQLWVVVRRGSAGVSQDRLQYIELGAPGSGIRRVLDELFRFHRIVRQINPDLVINPNESIPARVKAPLLAMAQNLLFHCPAISPLSTGPLWARLRSRLQFAFYRWRMPRAYAKAQVVVTVSSHAAHELSRYAGLDLDKVRVVPYGADRLPVQESGPAERQAAILVVGAVAEYKRLDHAIRALSILRAAGEPYELWLAGNPWPGEAQRLLSLAESVSVAPYVKLLGSVESDRLVELYASARIGLALSACESFCIPVVEGMNAGLPHVVADEPWSAETVADAAIRVDGSDPESIASGIKRLTDRTEWTRMAELGRNRAARYTWQANAAGIAAAAVTAVEASRGSGTT